MRLRANLLKRLFAFLRPQAKVGTPGLHGFFSNACALTFPWAAVLAAIFLGELAFGAQVQLSPSFGKDIHFTGDRTFWDRKQNRMHLEGNAALHRPGESITADVIDIDQNTRMVEARGHCVYYSGEMVIQGDAFSFNLDTRKGVITNGRVSSKTYSLTGKVLRRVASRRFLTEEGSYSTCMDCPQSWTLLGSEVDMEFEEYGRMKNVMAVVKDVPVFWVPYLVIPLKSRRQSGLLFPNFGYRNEGFTFVQSYFWDVSRSVDMTFGLGYYTGRGARFEWEGRYALTPRSGGKLNLYTLRDVAFEEFLVSKGLEPSSHRWAIAIEQTQELPFGIEQKLKLYEMSDQLYPTRVGDIPGNGEAFVGSEFFLSHSTNEVSTWLGAKYYRNLVSLDPDPRTRDPSTVQVLPMARISTNDKYLWDGAVALGGSLGLANFVREGSFFDRDLFTEALPGEGFRPGIDPIRRGTRLSLFPKVSTVIRPFDAFSLVPSVQYRAYLYSFPEEVESLSRGYLQTRVQAQAQLERIYETDDPQIPRVKHIIRPRLTWSKIPLRNEDATHPFIRQLNYAESNGFSGFQFDSDDTVPFGTTGDANVYFIPQGHSIGFDFNSQLIQRLGALDQPAVYRRAVEVTAGESIDLLEYQKSPSIARPLSRFNLGVNTDFGWLTSNLLYFYWPYGQISDTQSRHQVTAQATWVLERGLRQEILAFDRSFNLSYTHKQIGADRTNLLSFGSTFSVNDYLMPRAQLTYDLLTESLQRADAAIRIQHPSRCYQLELMGSRFVCPIQRAEDTGVCYGFNFNLIMNLTGSSFMGVDQVAAGAPLIR
jgi:LPS-assembly protein